MRTRRTWTRCAANWTTSNGTGTGRGADFTPHSPLPSPPRRPGEGGRAAALLTFSILLAGCASAPGPRPVPGHGAAAWEIPAPVLHTQRLYRVHYSGPEGEGSFKVTLRLTAPERYQIQAVDPVGRSLWSLDVAHSRGLFLNHRNRSSCVYEGSFDLSGVALGPFPLLTLPSLLVGRVPSLPSEPPQQHGSQVSFHDAAGRVWTAVLGSDGVVQSWTLAEGGAPSIWWVRSEDWAILSDRERNVQVRWREVLHEPLDGEPVPLETPSGYRTGPCRDQNLSGTSDREPSEPPGI